MSQVYTAFYRGRAERFFSLARFSDWLTRQVTRGPYSYCELVERLPDGLFICYSSSVRDKGVRSKRMPLPIEKWDLLPINADQTQPVVVAVRVAEGDSAAETTANIIGGSTPAGKYTSMKALLDSQTKLKIKPRILAVPGLDFLPVATELVSISQQLRAFSYLSAFGAQTKEEAVLYRDQLGAREAMIIWPDFVGFDTQAAAERTLYATARAVGLRAKIDEETGWHKTLSNVDVNGVTGISRSVFWDLQSMSVFCRRPRRKQRIPRTHRRGAGRYRRYFSLAAVGNGRSHTKRNPLLAGTGPPAQRGR